MSLSNLRNSSKAFLVIFTFLTVSLCTGGYLLYLHQKRDITFEKNNELAVINKLKTEQIANWRNNLLSNAKAIFFNQPVITHIHELDLGINTKINHRNISKWAASLLKEFDCSKVMLVNPVGEVIINTHSNAPLTKTGKQIIAQSIQKKNIVISDFSWYNKNTICIFMAVPLYLDADKHEGFSGVALLNIDPEHYLYPLIRSWPTLSQTGENMIVRRDGENVLYLNELRHYKNSALRLSMPLKESQLWAIRAIIGNKGTIEELDYRGIKVLADIDSVPNTPWYIVSKVDSDEVFQPIRNQAILVFSFTFLLISICALVLYLIWKSHFIKSEHERQTLLMHFDYLVKYANDIIILSDFNGNIHEVNNRTINEYGYSRDEFLKMNLKQLRCPETKSALSEQLDLLNEKNGLLYETLHVRKNGNIFPIEISGRIMEVDGIKYYQAIIRDITDRKKIEADLIKAKEKAEESDRLKTAFLNNMSHEIRTPMNGILGFSELLEDETLPPEERRQYINIINNNSLHLLSIINDIIDISEIESKQISLSKVSFNLNQLLDELLISYQNEKTLIGKTGITLTLEKAFDEENSMIISDDLRIRQILYNLLNNSMKFTDKGFIKFGYADMGDVLQFFVQDFGKGIPKDKQSIIFERFRQEEENYTRQFGGNGLGLSISKGLVELLGGNMWLISDEGIGTTFYFTIPYTMFDMNPVFIKKKKPQKALYNFYGKKILIVEDNYTNSDLLDDYFSNTQAKLFFAKDGKEAVENCKSNRDYDLVLMNIQLPVMNGYEATREIKKFMPDLPVVALTGYAQAEDMEKCIEAGCNDFLSKPINKAILFMTINRFLKQ